MATQSHPDVHQAFARRVRPVARDENFNIRARCITISISVLALFVVLIALFLV